MLNPRLLHSAKSNVSASKTSIKSAYSCNSKLKRQVQSNGLKSDKSRTSDLNISHNANKNEQKSTRKKESSNYIYKTQKDKNLQPDKPLTDEADMTKHINNHRKLNRQKPANAYFMTRDIPLVNLPDNDLFNKTPNPTPKPTAYSLNVQHQQVVKSLKKLFNNNENASRMSFQNKSRNSAPIESEGGGGEESQETATTETTTESETTASAPTPVGEKSESTAETSKEETTKGETSKEETSSKSSSTLSMPTESESALVTNIFGSSKKSILSSKPSFRSKGASSKVSSGKSVRISKSSIKSSKRSGRRSKYGKKKKGGSRSGKKVAIENWLSSAPTKSKIREPNSLKTIYLRNPKYTSSTISHVLVRNDRLRTSDRAQNTEWVKCRPVSPNKTLTKYGSKTKFCETVCTKKNNINDIIRQFRQTEAQSCYIPKPRASMRCVRQLSPTPCIPAPCVATACVPQPISQGYCYRPGTQQCAFREPFLCPAPTFNCPKVSEVRNVFTPNIVDRALCWTYQGTSGTHANPPLRHPQTHQQLCYNQMATSQGPVAEAMNNLLGLNQNLVQTKCLNDGVTAEMNQPPMYSCNLVPPSIYHTMPHAMPNCLPMQQPVQNPMHQSMHCTPQCVPPSMGPASYPPAFNLQFEQQCMNTAKRFQYPTSNQPQPINRLKGCVQPSFDLKKELHKLTEKMKEKCFDLETFQQLLMLEKGLH